MSDIKLKIGDKIRVRTWASPEQEAEFGSVPAKIESILENGDCLFTIMGKRFFAQADDLVLAEDEKK